MRTITSIVRALWLPERRAFAWGYINMVVWRKDTRVVNTRQRRSPDFQMKILIGQLRNAIVKLKIAATFAFRKFNQSIMCCVFDQPIGTSVYFFVRYERFAHYHNTKGSLAQILDVAMLWRNLSMLLAVHIILIFLYRRLAYEDDQMRFTILEDIQHNIKTDRSYWYELAFWSYSKTRLLCTYSSSQHWYIYMTNFDMIEYRLPVFVINPLVFEYKLIVFVINSRVFKY